MGILTDRIAYPLGGLWKGANNAGAARTFERIVYDTPTDQFIVGDSGGWIALLNPENITIVEGVATSPAAGVGTLECNALVPDFSSSAFDYIYFGRFDAVGFTSDLSVATKAGAGWPTNCLAYFTVPGSDVHYLLDEDLFSSNDFWATNATEINGLFASPGAVAFCQSADGGAFAARANLQIAFLSTSTDPTDINNWEILNSSLGSQGIMSINDAGTRVIAGGSAGQVLIWDVGNSANFVALDKNPFLNGTNPASGSAMDIYANYVPGWEGFFIVNQFGNIGFLPDGDNEIFLINRPTKLADAVDTNIVGGVIGGYDPNRDLFLYGIGPASGTNIFYAATRTP